MPANQLLFSEKVLTSLDNGPIVDSDSRLNVSPIGTLWFASLARPLGLRSLNVKRSANVHTSNPQIFRLGYVRNLLQYPSLPIDPLLSLARFGSGL